MTQPHLGFVFDTEGLDALVPSAAEMSVIGAVVTAPDKQAGIDYNKPYAITTDDSAFITSLGAGGTARQTIEGVGKQLGQLSRSSRMVIVVVEEGDNADAALALTETIGNVAGSAIDKTGVHAMKKAGQTVNVIPRILIAPGFTSQQADNAGTLLQNAVCAELSSVCESLLAVAPVTGPATTRQAALDWRETLGSKRLIPTETDVLITGAGGTPVQVPSDAYVAGLINRVDELHGGLPFHSAGNRSLYGVLGPNRTMDFSLTDGDTEGQQLLAADLGIIVRGEGGDDFSIAEGGVLYLGTGTASNESLWRFYNQVRGRDWIHLTLLRTLRELLAKNNLNGRLVQTFVNTIRQILSRLAAEERIHRDFEVKLDPALNTPGELRAGSLTVKMAVEEPSPFMRGIIKSSRYEFALTSFVENLASQVNEVAL